MLHDEQVDSFRTRTSWGEAVDCTKWNCPMGQMYLQKLAPRKKESTTVAARK